MGGGYITAVKEEPTRGAEEGKAGSQRLARERCQIAFLWHAAILRGGEEEEEGRSMNERRGKEFSYTATGNESKQQTEKEKGRMERVGSTFSTYSYFDAKPEVCRFIGHKCSQTGSLENSNMSISFLWGCVQTRDLRWEKKRKGGCRRYSFDSAGKGGRKGDGFTSYFPAHMASTFLRECVCDAPLPPFR